MNAVQQNTTPSEAERTETRVGRCRFSSETKQRILTEASACKRGELGLLLRREGIYSGMLKRWRMEASAGRQSGLEAKKRGRKPLAPKAENERLQREVDRLQNKLKQAELIIDVQKKTLHDVGLDAGRGGRLMKAVQKVRERVGIKRSCDLFGVSRMTEYRMRRFYTGVAQLRKEPVRVDPRALTATEQQTVLSVLSSEEFIDSAPAAVYASLLEKGSYHCSQSTMYRLPRKHKATAGRRQIRRHTTYEAPQLLAQAPNQV